MVGLFYYGYSPFSLVAGVAMDRLGPRRVVPIGAAVVGIGALAAFAIPRRRRADEVPAARPELEPLPEAA
jgi:MFS family permease